MTLPTDERMTYAIRKAGNRLACLSRVKDRPQKGETHPDPEFDYQTCNLAKWGPAAFWKFERLGVQGLRPVYRIRTFRHDRYLTLGTKFGTNGRIHYSIIASKKGAGMQKWWLNTHSYRDKGEQKYRVNIIADFTATNGDSLALCGLKGNKQSNELGAWVSAVGYRGKTESGILSNALMQWELEPQERK